MKSASILVIIAVFAVCAAAQEPKQKAAPKGGQKAAQAKARAPEAGLNMLERLNRMTPAERQKALERLPPERRQMLEQRLNNYQRLSPEERERLRNRLRQMSPEQRKALRNFGQIPPERRQAVRRELFRLRQMSPEDRETRLSSQEFQSAYSPEERELLRDMAKSPVRQQ
jgi:hypothetical protein